MMVREHFSVCEEIPLEVRQKYVTLKQMAKRGEIELKSYWKNSAIELGMMDVDKKMK